MSRTLNPTMFMPPVNHILPGLILTLTLMLAGCQNMKPGYGLKLYVSPQGNDAWSGTISEPDKGNTDGPFATLTGARDAIRKLKKEGRLPGGKILVGVKEGIYELPGTFDLNEYDSGKDSLSGIIYSGEKGKEVRLSGGKFINEWKPVTDSHILEKLDPAVRQSIFQADLSAIGIDDFGTPAGGGSELFFNDQPMQISRYPNKGYIKIAGVLNIDPVDVRGTKGDLKGRFKYDDKRVARWTEEKDPWVHGYWFWDWSEQRHPIKEIDTTRKILEVVPPYHNYGYRTGQWFYGYNMLSEIDEPGEYYIDRETKIIYFYPPSDIVTGTAYVSVNKNIISMSKVSWVTVRGMILEGCRETAALMNDCRGSMVEACTVRNNGDGGVYIERGEGNGVTGCDIYGNGAGGIRIDAGDRKNLIPGRCFADNNYIHHIARLKRVYNPGISITGVGNRISHNLIAKLPHMAIGFMGNDHLIEYNEIDSACYESNDAGAIYTGRNWTMRGNIIRYNYLHNISGFGGKGCVGIYLDDAFSSAEVYGNVFKNVTRAMMIGGGRDNKVINNIFISCVPSIHVDARGLGWMRNEHIPGWISEARDSGTILGVAYNKPPYSTRYPELVNIIDDEPRAPKGNIISHNICVGGVWDKASGFWHMSVEDKARPYLTMEENIVSPDSQVEDSLSKSIIVADPGFADKSDPERGSFRLDNGSAPLEHSFKQIPFEKIGPYESDLRASWPVIRK